MKWIGQYIVDLIARFRGDVYIEKSDLYIYDASSDTRYHLLFCTSLPVGASLLLDSNDMLAFNNSVNSFSLNIKLGSTSDLINVLIKR